MVLEVVLQFKLGEPDAVFQTEPRGMAVRSSLFAVAPALYICSGRGIWRRARRSKLRIWRDGRKAELERGKPHL